MTSYFEITGEIIECHVVDSDAPPRILSSYGSMQVSSPQGLKVRKGPAAQGAAGGKREDLANDMIARAMISTGVSILMVPDPLPVVDEVVAVGMIAAGGTMLFGSSLTEWWNDNYPTMDASERTRRRVKELGFSHNK